MLKNANLELRVCSGATSEDDLAADSSSFPGIASVACAFHPCCFSCFRGAAQGSSLYMETYVFHVGRPIWLSKLLIFGKGRKGKLFTCDANQTK